MSLINALNDRQKEGRLRALKPKEIGIDFYSNDYLGMARNTLFQDRLVNIINNNPRILLGATGSRLISGNSKITETVETYIANIHGVERALVFSSGYSANLALYSSILKRTDTVILDELVHRSVIDGCRLGLGTTWKFKHNNLEHLEHLLKKSKGAIYVGVESIYSMDGDFASLKEIAILCKRYKANLIVDEAHAFAVYGIGIVDELGIQDMVFATVITYGKAMGLHGAAILGSNIMINYLINYASTFIYTTAMPDFHALSIQEGYEFIANNTQLKDELFTNIKLYKSLITSCNTSNSAIQPFIISELEARNELINSLKESGILCYAISSPTVAKGSERLRVCLHSFNTKEEIQLLSTIINNCVYE